MTPDGANPDGAGPDEHVERTMSDDPDQRASDAAVRRADERIRHADPAVRAELRQRRRRTNRVYIGIGVGVALLLIGYVALYFLPVLSVRDITVTGAETVSEEQVIDQVQVASGTPLLQVDANAVANRIAGIPEISEVTVRREYPSTLAVEIVQREALVTVELDGTEHLVDARGVNFGQGVAPEDTPRLEISDDVRDELPGLVPELAEVFGAAREFAQLHIVEARIDSPDDFELVLEDGRTIEWGSPEDNRAKAEALSVVLSQPGEIWNVSNPAMPTSR